MGNGTVSSGNGGVSRDSPKLNPFLPYFVKCVSNRKVAGDGAVRFTLAVNEALTPSFPVDLRVGGAQATKISLVALS